MASHAKAHIIGLPGYRRKRLGNSPDTRGSVEIKAPISVSGHPVSADIIDSALHTRGDPWRFDHSPARYGCRTRL